MEQASAAPSTPSSAPQPPEQPQTPPSSVYLNPTTTATATTTPPPPTISSLPPTTTTHLSSTQSSVSSAPSPNSLTPQPSQQLLPPHARPQFSRPWKPQQPPSSFSHYSLPVPPLPIPSHSSSTNSPSPALSVSPAPRGGMAIGVPAHHPGVSAPQTNFPSINSPFGQSSAGMGRNVSDSGLGSTSSQVGQSMGMGMAGTLGSSSAMRPPGILSNPLRPMQSTTRPQSPSTQNFQGHGTMRVSSIGSPGSPLPNISQSPQGQNQPWLASGSQGKPPLPPTSLRPQLNTQPAQQRPNLSHQHHPSISTTTQQAQVISVLQSQQSPSPGLPQEQHGQQHPPSRILQSPPNQQQIVRSQGTGAERPHSTIQSSSVQSGPLSRAIVAEPEEVCDRILSKRSIQELVAQVDPSEKLDPEVEDILIDIADDFIESITTFGCSLAKHRKSTTLEAKDILLHLERNWNMSIPGFSGDELRTYKKQLTTDIHKERLAVIKKSILNADITNSKSTTGQAGGNPKGHLAKGPSIVGSPAVKLREPA